MCPPPSRQVFPTKFTKEVPNDVTGVSVGASFVTSSFQELYCFMVLATLAIPVES